MSCRESSSAAGNSSGPGAPEPGSSGYAWLVLYNAIFILPLAGILVLASRRTGLSRLAHWNLHRRAWVRLALGSGVAVMGLAVMATL